MQQHAHVPCFRGTLLDEPVRVQVRMFKDNIRQRPFGSMIPEFACPCIVTFPTELYQILIRNYKEDDMMVKLLGKGVVLPHDFQVPICVANVREILLNYGKVRWGREFLSAFGLKSLTALVNLVSGALCWAGAIPRPLPRSGRFRIPIIDFLMAMLYPTDAIEHPRKIKCPELQHYPPYIGKTPLSSRSPFTIISMKRKIDGLLRSGAVTIRNKGRWTKIQQCVDVCDRVRGAKYGDPLLPYDKFRFIYAELFECIPVAEDLSEFMNMNNDDNDTTIPTAEISVVDPLSSERIEYPCKGASCNHTECFDLRSVLYVFMMRSEAKCPICSLPLFLPDIRIDWNMWQVLVETPPELDYVRLKIYARLDPLFWDPAMSCSAQNQTAGSIYDGHPLAPTLLMLPAADDFRAW